MPAIGRGATEATTDLGARSPREGCVSGGDWGRQNESGRSFTPRAAEDIYREQDARVYR